ncbi:MAG: hypothetical protein CMH07_03985, partial [Marinovum sp.]|nr:hypothetical protein [Marinovum sp.]
MDYASLDDFFKSGKHHLQKGPIALIFAEDDVELASTILHHSKLGFTKIIIFTKAMPTLPSEFKNNLVSVYVDLFNSPEISVIINKINILASSQWVYFFYNAEYLFFPFCETRSVAELLNFHSEERREAMLTFVVDLYTKDFTNPAEATSLEYTLANSTGSPAS